MAREGTTLSNLDHRITQHSFAPLFHYSGLSDEDGIAVVFNLAQRNRLFRTHKCRFGARPNFLTALASSYKLVILKTIITKWTAW